MAIVALVVAGVMTAVKVTAVIVMLGAILRPMKALLVRCEERHSCIRFH